MELLRRVIRGRRFESCPICAIMIGTCAGYDTGGRNVALVEARDGVTGTTLRYS
jgi:hypothetical protein